MEHYKAREGQVQKVFEWGMPDKRRWWIRASIFRYFDREIGEYVSLVVEYIQQHGNPFDISKPRELINLTNRSKIDKEDANFLLNCPSLGKIECNEFYATRFEKKSLKLFDTIPKTRKIKKVTPKQTKQDLNRDCEILANCRLCSSKRIWLTIDVKIWNINYIFLFDKRWLHL